jgi:hypothetical protein
MAATEFTKALELFRASFPNQIETFRLIRISQYFSYTAFVADALTEAVVNHLREMAIANPDFRMPNCQDPAVIVKTLLDFFGGSISETDGLELMLAPEGSDVNHPMITPGKREHIEGKFIRNAINLMMRVPLVPEWQGDKIFNFSFPDSHFFFDTQGFDRWQAVQRSRHLALGT